MTKPWTPLEGLDPTALPGQLGVFQLAEGSGRVVCIGFAGGRDPFGLRSAVPAAIEAVAAALGEPPTHLRYEVTHGYLSRWEELIMVHVHDHGAPPVVTTGERVPAGRLTPDGSPSPAVLDGGN